MPRRTADDFAPEVLKLFDQYVRGGISRRGFLDRAVDATRAARLRRSQQLALPTQQGTRPAAAGR